MAKLITSVGELQKAMAGLGENWQLAPELFLMLQEFTCRIYASQSPITQVNELQYQLFRLKRGDIESGQLPPCEDTLYLHAQRANYQAAIWRRSLERHPNIPSPEGHGWLLEDDQLKIDWMKGPPAPDAVLEFLACKCTKVCRPPGCQCITNGIKCTPACKLQTCDNMVEEDNLDIQEHTDEDNDDE